MHRKIKEIACAYCRGCLLHALTTTPLPLHSKAPPHTHTHTHCNIAVVITFVWVVVVTHDPTRATSVLK
jgi:hypothetical protein